MRSKIRACLIGAVVIAALSLGALSAVAGDAYELYQIIPENVDSFVYLRDLRAGLRPLLSSDYFDEVGDLSLFEGPIKSDLSAPMLSRLGTIEKMTGIRPTLKRFLWVIGARAVFYRTTLEGKEASAALLETGWFKGFLINLFSIFSSHVTKENWGSYSVWVVASTDKKIYYKNVKGYTIVSDSPDLFKSEWDIVTGQNPKNLSGNPAVMDRLSHLPKDYHILFYSTKAMSPDDSEMGIVAHARRLLKGTDALLFSVTFSEAGADITLFAPYTGGEGKSLLAGLGSLSDKATIDLSAMPGETAALVAFRAFDPGILYTHFGKVWFTDIAQKVNYISILKKWKDKGGFDLEGGIINNLGRGALAALVGIGYEGEKPYLRTIASVGVAPGKEEALSTNIGKLYSYSFFRCGPVSPRA